MNILVEGKGANGVVILSHGAGMPMDHEYLNKISTALAALGLKVVRFEFPYMSERRVIGKKKFPDKMPVLEQCFFEVIDYVRKYHMAEGAPLYLAGKSLGGRVATLVADQAMVKAVFVLGYPFHPIGKPEKLRVEHLSTINTPVYIFQGERDKFGCKEEVVNYLLGKKVSVHWLGDGDHDLVPRVRSGFSFEQHLSMLSEMIRAVVYKD
jgi:predicted alpha/beta-hydrolase family hydrolase